MEVNGGQQVVVDSVALVDSNNLQLVGSYLLPDSSYIQSTEAPRKAEMDSGSPPTWHWSERQPAVGAVLDPNLPSYQLVVAAETEAPGEGTAKGIEVSYHDASGQFVRRDPFEIVMGSRRCD